jgi:fumarylacetoacetate (FAA) hydrolase
MKLATIDDGSRDGRLVVVSRDGARYLEPEPVATMQQALDTWAETSPALGNLAGEADEGAGAPTANARFLAPLPRAWQWLDGSAYDSHGALMQKAFGLDAIETDAPLMYQGMSHRFLAATDDVPFRDEADGIDFEGEFGVMTDDVPMGVSAADALHHIKLVVQINDWSLRVIAPKEMKTGFGWIQAKPACSTAPFAVTPDELGDAWKNGRAHLDLVVRWNGKAFGNANGGAMSVGFHELVAHAAGTRSLCAGTIIGSGTVSNRNYEEVGSSCIAEKRGIEIVELGEPKTPFMHFGDRVFMEARMPDGGLLFGAIDQRVVQA